MGRTCTVEHLVIEPVAVIAQLVKNLPAMQIWVQFLGQKDPLEKKNGNPLQCSCLENPMDKGVWQATVHGVARVGYNLVTKPPPAVNQGCQSMTPFPPQIIQMTLP